MVSALDSPGYRPEFSGTVTSVKLPLCALGLPKGVFCDGVTAGLRVNVSLRSPLLCVTDVFDTALGKETTDGLKKFQIQLDYLLRGKAVV